MRVVVPGETRREVSLPDSTLEPMGVHLINPWTQP